MARLESILVARHQLNILERGSLSIFQEMRTWDTSVMLLQWTGVVNFQDMRRYFSVCEMVCVLGASLVIAATLRSVVWFVCFVVKLTQDAIGCVVNLRL